MINFSRGAQEVPKQQRLPNIISSVTNFVSFSCLATKTRHMWFSYNVFYVVHRMTGTNVSIFRESITTPNSKILCLVAVICLPTQTFGPRLC